MLDIARSGAAKDVCAVIPYFSYARSDKKDAPRISIAARLVADMLVTAGATQVITMTLHSPQVHGFFTVPTDHLTAHSVFLEHLRKKDLSNAVLVAPDVGHAKRTGKLAKVLNVPMAAGEKDRLSDNNVTITDYGGRSQQGRDYRRRRDRHRRHYFRNCGQDAARVNVRRVTVVGTHGLFTGPAVERLNAIDAIDEILITDTVPLPEERRPERLKVLGREDLRRGYPLQCPGRVGRLLLRILAHVLRPHVALQGMEASSDDRSAGRGE